MSAKPESLWTRLFNDLTEWINGIVEIRIVTGFDPDGRVRTTSTDPDEIGQTVISRLRGPAILTGDQVLVMRIPGGRRVILAPFAKSTDETVEYVSSLGGDGSSVDAARADHEHVPESGNVNGMEIGGGASATLSGMAIGRNAKAADAAVGVGISSDASGYVSTAVGYEATAAGQYAVSMGYSADATGNESTAIGWGSGASGGGAVAIGGNKLVSGFRAWTLGYGGSNSTNYRGILSANQVFIQRADAAAAQTALYLMNSDGEWNGIAFGGDRLFTGNNAYVRRGDSVGFIFPVNRKVGASAAPLKSYPDDAAGGVAMPAGHQMFVYGGFTNAGYAWYCVISGSYGTGYVKQTLTVAL